MVSKSTTKRATIITYTVRGVSAVTHKKHSVDLLQCKRTRYESLSKAHTCLLIDLSVELRAEELITICHTMQTANCMQECRDFSGFTGLHEVFMTAGDQR